MDKCAPNTLKPYSQYSWPRVQYLDSTCPQQPQQTQDGYSHPPWKSCTMPNPAATILPLKPEASHHLSTAYQPDSEFKPQQSGVNAPQYQPMPTSYIPHPVVYQSVMHAETICYTNTAVSSQARFGPPVPQFLPPNLPQVPSYPCYLPSIPQICNKTTDPTSNPFLDPPSAPTAIPEMNLLRQEFAFQNPQSANEAHNQYCSSAMLGFCAPHLMLSSSHTAYINPSAAVFPYHNLNCIPKTATGRKRIKQLQGEIKIAHHKRRKLLQLMRRKRNRRTNPRNEDLNLSASLANTTPQRRFYQTVFDFEETKKFTLCHQLVYPQQIVFDIKVYQNTKIVLGML